MARQLAQESPSANEATMIEEFITIFKQQMQETQAKAADGLMRRGAHPKAHACVLAEFRIDDNLPDHLRVGIFAQPRTYAARVRLSNANVAQDATPDMRGLAIKLLGVDGDFNLPNAPREQDFLLVTHPVFMSGNAGDFLAFTRAFEAGQPLLHFVNLLDPHPIGLRNLFAAAQTTGNLLAERYWSITPYLFGTGRAVKYGLIPQTAQGDAMPLDPGSDFLGEALAQALAAQAVSFTFAVQLQRDPHRQPIEDATVLWDEDDAPFERVATLTLLRQDTPLPATECEAMRFNPWHSLSAHRPLGGLNRVRKAVYVALSDFRRTTNAAPGLP